MFEKLKEHKATLSALGFVVSIAMGVFFIEDRYAKAADVQVISVEQKVHVTKVINDFKKQELNDKIFILEFKEQSNEATPLDKALKTRYLEQLKGIK